MFERETEETKKAKRKEEEESEPLIQTDEAVSKGIVGLLKTPDPDLMSQIDSDEIPSLAGLGMRATKYNIGCLQTFLENWLKFRVSHDRKGRKEIYGIAKAAREADEKRSRMDKMRSLFGMGDEY